MENKPIFVLAGNREQYGEYLRSKGLSQHHRSHIHLHSEHQLRGYKNPEIVRIGSWREIRNIAEIERMILVRSR